MFHIRTGHDGVHHSDGTARKAEFHGLEGTLARPFDKVVDFGEGVFDFVSVHVRSLSTPPRLFS